MNGQHIHVHDVFVWSFSAGVPKLPPDCVRIVQMLGFRLGLEIFPGCFLNGMLLLVTSTLFCLDEFILLLREYNVHHTLNLNFILYLINVTLYR